MGFAGMESFGQGLDQGTQIMARMQQMRMLQEQRQREQAARRAAGNAYMSPGAAPQPPMPGVASPPAPPARMMDMSDLMTQQDPTEMGMAPPPPMAPPAGAMIPSGGAPPLPPPPQPMPIPMNADGAPMAGAEPAAAAAPPPVGAGGDPMPTQGDNAVQGAQETIRSIAQQIKDANPGIAPEALFDATGLQIEQMKGVRNEVKDYMQLQVELAKLQTKLGIAEKQIEGRQGVAETAADARVEAAQIGGDSRERVAGTQAGARVEAASIAANSRQTVAQLAAQARVTVGQLGANSREAVAATNADARRYDSDQDYRARVNAAAIEMGVAMPAAGGVRQPKSSWSGPARAVPRGGGAAGGSYPSLKALQDAFKAGKVDADTAQRIAKEKGWAS